MTMVFERVLTPGIAQLSYLIGDAGDGVAAVIDPRPDCEVYLQLARRHSVAITHIFESHIHADFMSGARELADRLGQAHVCVSGAGGAKYGFDVEKVRDGDRFEFGSVILTARFTPGHTPEHIALEISEQDHADTPWGVFTGDSLFVGSAGRPDLLADEQTEELTQQLFQTLSDYYLALDDGVVIFPCHGAGSACGAEIGERPMSTIGYERRFNEFLHYDDRADFSRFVREGAPPEPHHYKRLKKINANGPAILGRLPSIPPMPPRAFREAVEAGKAQLVDARQMLAFGGGHIASAINIGPRSELSVWAGQMLDADKPILLVVDDETKLDWFLALFLRTGFTEFMGYLVGGMKSWDNAGLPMQKLPQMTVQEVREHQHEVQLLDVRAPSEWENGHIPGAVHHFVGDLRNGDGEGSAGEPPIDQRKPVVVYCDTGYRANLAASLLQARGYEDVRNVPGSWQAWKKAGYPIEK